MKNHIKRNYNGEKIKFEEILVPIMVTANQTLTLIRH